MTRIAFAGPSLWGVPGPLPGEIEIRDPAARGDVLRAVSDGATAIAVIDGFFADRPSVGHKEILQALSLGVPVLGGASMGALRAAELQAFGMRGVGSIFRAYATGRRTEDADVALLHAPADLGWRPLTRALVDIDATLAQRADAWTPRLRAAARRLHYSERTWRRVVAEAGAPLAIAADLRRATVHLKRADALQTLESLRDAGPIEPLAFASTRAFEEDRGRYLSDDGTEKAM